MTASRSSSNFGNASTSTIPSKRSINQLLRVNYALDGSRNKIDFSNDSASTTEYLLQAWEHRGDCHFSEFRRRYDLIKSIGSRSFSSLAESSSSPQVQPVVTPPTRIDPPQKITASIPRVRRNDPCPCGSGRKYKRCCATRQPSRLISFSFFRKCLLRHLRTSFKFIGRSRIHCCRRTFLSCPLTMPHPR